jgi:hypothetical protein
VISVGLTPAELWAVWPHATRSAPPAVLGLRSPGRDRIAHDRAVAAARGTLTHRGLLDEHGHPTPELTHALRVLAGPDHTLDLRHAAAPDRMTVGLGAVRGGHGAVVLTEQTAGPRDTAVAESYDLAVGDATGVADTLLATLGPIRRGPGRPVNIPTDLLDGALAAHGPDRWAVADHLAARGVDRAETDALARMVTDVRAGAQLGAPVAGRRAGHVVGVHATRRGWYVQLRRAGTLTVAPADAATLARHWHELVSHPGPVDPAIG